MKKQILALVMGTALLSGCSYLCEDCMDGGKTCPAKTATTAVVSEKDNYAGGPTFFAFNSAELTSTYKADLRKTAAQIKAEKAKKVLVKAYADTIGTEAYNIKLSQRRADTVANYLVQEGVCKKSITAKGYGSTSSFDAASTPAGRAQNRRAEVIFE